MSLPPSYVRLEMTGAPQAVDVVAEQLSGHHELVSLSRSAPNPRGEITSLADVFLHEDQVPGPPGERAPGPVTYVLQVVVDLLPPPAGEPPAGDVPQVEAAAAQLLQQLPGCTGLGVRAVARRPTHTPRA
ncbi:hypothetical protein [Streptomyces sp. NPDC059003]|uniref:hypothetical protein n=1 Tax=Streptomyces sp. NPDC059003 TaxID=3346691 RepID=UPI00368121CD